MNPRVLLGHIFNVCRCCPLRWGTRRDSKFGIGFIKKKMGAVLGIWGSNYLSYVFGRRWTEVQETGLNFRYV